MVPLVTLYNEGMAGLSLQAPGPLLLVGATQHCSELAHAVPCHFASRETETLGDNQTARALVFQLNCLGELDALAPTPTHIYIT